MGHGLPAAPSCRTASSPQTDDTGVNISRGPEVWSIQQGPRGCIDLPKIVRLTKIRHSKIGQGQGRQHQHRAGHFEDSQITEVHLSFPAAGAPRSTTHGSGRCGVQPSSCEHLAGFRPRDPNDSWRGLRGKEEPLLTTCASRAVTGISVASPSLWSGTY